MNFFSWKRVSVSACFLSFSLGLCFQAGCGLNREIPRGATPTSRQLAAWLRTAKDPTMYWLRVGVNEASEPVFEGANRVHEGTFVEMPMEKVDDLPYPFFTQESRDNDKLRVLVDTSSKESWCDFLAANAWKTKPLKLTSNQALPRHVVDQTFSYRATTDRVKIGEMRIETPILHVRPVYETLGPISRDVPVAKSPTVVVGNELLSRFRTVHLDFPQRRLIMAATKEYRVEPDTDAVIVPLTAFRGGLTIPVRINGEKRGAILDTGGDFGVALGQGSRPTSTLQIGDIELLHVMTVGHDARDLGEKDVARVGMQVLKDYRLTFDFKNDVDGTPQWRAIFEKPFVKDLVPEKRFRIQRRGDLPEIDRPREVGREAIEPEQRDIPNGRQK